jgi:hypothetical protein
MHGEIRKSRCQGCGAVAAHLNDLGTATVCAACCRAGGLRPHIVWFGETPFGMEDAYAALEQADIFAAIGTSGLVYPAAGFADVAARNGRGCESYEINPNPTGGAFRHVIAAPAVQGVPEFAAASVTVTRKEFAKCQPRQSRYPPAIRCAPIVPACGSAGSAKWPAIGIPSDGRQDQYFAEGEDGTSHRTAG